MTATYKLISIEHAVEVGTTLSRSWFRGHAKLCGELAPRLFRKECLKLQEWLPQLELSLIHNFKRGAPALEANLPNQDDRIAWLFLMQHHGAPTRLLDWSKSILVALYFAVFEDFSSDGELWAMYPDELNNCSGFFGLPLPNYPVLQYFAREPYGNHDKIANELQLSKKPNRPIAVEPPMNFPRMVTQLSTFTVHPKPEPGNSIPELLTDEKYLVRYVIPKNSKDKIRQNLTSLGITRSTLFPDLDSLATDIIQEHHIIAYNPPIPPRCGGNYDCESVT